MPRKSKAAPVDSVKVGKPVIEKNIPLPIDDRFPFHEMEIGDSFFTTLDAVTAYNAAMSAERMFGHRYCGAREKAGVRIWRTA